MELKNDFVVDRPVNETWQILTNLELIAPCLPGARLEEVEGEEYRGSVSVKVGPITGKYKGKAHFVEQDEANRVARLRAEGRDPRQGNANALITAAMTSAGSDGNQTRVDLTTDLGLSGKIASFARGNLEDVSRKLLTQFAENLEQMLAQQGSGAAGAASATPATAGSASAAPSGTPGAESGQPVAAAVPGDLISGPDSATAGAATLSAGGPASLGDVTAPGAPAGAAFGGENTPGSITLPGGSDSAPTQAATPPAGEQTSSTPTTAGSFESSAPATPTVRKINSPEAKPIDLLAVAGPNTMAKKLAPVAVVALLIILLRWFMRRRH
jgi:carbon monoxide dehydrogenase subunit G